MIAPFALLLIFTSQVFSRELPSYIKKCRLYDPSLPDCFRENVDIIKPYLAKGIPEFKIPPIDPLDLTKVVLNMSNFYTEFTKSSITGATHFDINELIFDVEKKYLRMVFFIPNVILSGDYSIDGKVMMLQLKSAGHSTSNIRNVTAIEEMRGYFEDRQGKSYLIFNDTSLKLTISPSSHFYFDNLFPGNEELTETTNNILNENLDELIRDFMPLIEDVVSAFTLNIILRIFKMFSIDELFIME